MITWSAMCQGLLPTRCLVESPEDPGNKVAITFCERSDRYDLRTFAPKSSYGEIFFISRLELAHKVLTPKMKKKLGHRLCFGENGSEKVP